MYLPLSKFESIHWVSNDSDSEHAPIIMIMMIMMHFYTINWFTL